MRWTRLDIPCPPEHTDLVVALVLSETGRGPSVEAGATQDIVQAYVPEAQEPAARERLIRRLSLAAPELGECARRLTAVPLAEADWEFAWREHFRAFRVSDRLVVKPSWEPWPPVDQPEAARAGDLVLEIDPGGAFGTGSHATTQLALQALDREVRPGSTVVDVGCGSGILTLAALALGAGQVVALDVDPAAVECTLENVKSHPRRSAAHVLEADGLASIRVAADLIVANITADLAGRVGEEAAARLREGGRYLATGFLEENVAAVAERLTAAGLVAERTDCLDGWACGTFEPPGSGVG